MALSHIQVKKLKKLFRAYDADGNGTLEEGDFVRLHQKRAAIRGWTPGSAAYDEYRETHIAYWKHVEAFADSDGDGQITIDEWLIAWAELVDGKPVTLGSFPPAIKRQVELTFDALDLDGDGEVGPNEYKLFLKALSSGEEGRSAEIFARLDLNGDGVLSKEEGLQLAAEFFFAAGDAPGNWLYGEI